MGFKGGQNVGQIPKSVQNTMFLSVTNDIGLYMVSTGARYIFVGI